MRLLFSLVLLVAVPDAKATDYFFEFTPRCRQAYQQYLSLKIPEGDQLIALERTQNRNNLLSVYLADYGDFLNLMFNADSKDLTDWRKEHSNRLDQLAGSSDLSPWKLYCKAGIHLHTALIFGRYGENLNAGMAFRAAFLEIKENNQRFKTFRPNELMYGLVQALAGAIPSDYQWLVSMLGIKGDVRSGLNLIKHFTENNQADPFAEEANIFYYYISFYLGNNQAVAWRYFSGSQFPVKNNLLHALIRAAIATNYHKAELAIQALEEARRMAQYTSFPIVDYELGNALLLKQDENAIVAFQRFTASSGQQMFQKDSWYKMALWWHLKGNSSKAEQCRGHILTAIGTFTDSDKQADRFAKEHVWPNPALLSSRLYSDGGYARQSLAALNGLTEKSFISQEEQTEYHYRFAKASEDTGDQRNAMLHYQRAIALGERLKGQYAARAALQLGLLYERTGDVHQAADFFRRCRSMKHHDFQTSLDEQAASGLSRLGQ